MPENEAWFRKRFGAVNAWVLGPGGGRNPGAGARRWPAFLEDGIAAVVDAPFAAEVRLEGFRIHARGVDLAQDWRGVHDDMLALIG